MTSPTPRRSQRNRSNNMPTKDHEASENTREEAQDVKYPRLPPMKKLPPMKTPRKQATAAELLYPSPSSSSRSKRINGQSESVLPPKPRPLTFQSGGGGNVSGLQHLSATDTGQVQVQDKENGPESEPEPEQQEQELEVPGKEYEVLDRDNEMLDENDEFDTGQIPCPIPPCSFVYETNEVEEIRHHLVEKHLLWYCFWCQEPLPAGASNAVTIGHLRRYHRQELLHVFGTKNCKACTVDGTSYIMVPLNRPMQVPPQAEDVAPVIPSRSALLNGLSRLDVTAASRLRSAAVQARDSPASPALPADYIPHDDIYCSRCLRKAPQVKDRTAGRSNMGRDAEMKYHIDPNRSCRIPNAIGDAVDLPNASGWIRVEDMPKNIIDVKKNFIAQHPAYKSTIYPPSIRATLWKYDPNNEDFKASWGLPWPPGQGSKVTQGVQDAPVAEGSPRSQKARAKRTIPEAPGTKAKDTPQTSQKNPFTEISQKLQQGLPVSQGSTESSNAPSKRKRTRTEHRGKVTDGAYRYQSDEDEDDGLAPDVDDLAPPLKRRRPKDPLYRPPVTGKDADHDSEDEALAQNSAKRSARKAKQSKDLTFKPGRDVGDSADDDDEGGVVLESVEVVSLNSTLKKGAGGKGQQDGKKKTKKDLTEQRGGAGPVAGQNVWSKFFGGKT